ncbi:signal recognition particle, SRP9/SRP14 subunit [Fimicolochytrium jonesii]|uniref:signal recognition particle, SRP9/SRP14 subunit n=1 Tax=Fimicolochytrium jonesii TaxID=1396493 RepID=UPI0022FEDE36|nr:signal recognition particle, SRP9/SRP14 subunit [Fimicolochytrium jonesii]KAI8815932.1 signal recognition particle, SRP9/SRP14 subunit [Fimicolochytrium jonesii]
MVYVDVWDDYERAVEKLYLAGPLKTRYVSKYRHKDGKLVLKVFDGATCLKFRTDRIPDLRKFERLNLSLMTRMQGRTPAPPAPPGQQTTAATAAADQGVVPMDIGEGSLASKSQTQSKTASSTSLNAGQKGGKGGKGKKKRK